MKHTRYSWKGFVVVAMALTLLVLPSVGCAPEGKEPIVFGDLSWDSAQVCNRVAAFILLHGYGYEAEYIPGDTITILQGLRSGDIEVNMEIWVENQLEPYGEALESGDVIDLGNNYGDNYQGWLVPTYMIEGDSERGIEAAAPGLKSVFDLPDYWELFKDPENPDKGRFINSIPGWMATIVNSAKLESYGLTDTYTDFVTGSDAALSGSMAAAYQKGEPWVGYYWAPTWVLGKFDMTLLEEPAYSEDLWTEEAGYACAYPSNNVNIALNAAFADANPDVVEMLDNFETTTAMINVVLAYMQDNGATTDEAAMFFLKEYDDVWETWVPGDVADAVKAALS
ncbi:MAG: ABC transporter substrate-binding protein [Dehalococcoidia bacterium]|nr:ABC transporter substrate-binding protein [Dehalococcoidia bacterium]